MSRKFEVRTVDGRLMVEQRTDGLYETIEGARYDERGRCVLTAPNPINMKVNGLPAPTAQGQGFEMLSLALILNEYGEKDAGSKALGMIEEREMIAVRGRLPRDCHNDGSVREVFENLGIVILNGGQCEDDLFFDVLLPEGWKMSGTHVLDHEGSVRGRISYKGAVYDRYAHVVFDCRFYTRDVFVMEDGSEWKPFGPDSWGDQYRLIDGKTDKVIAQYPIRRDYHYIPGDNIKRHSQIMSLQRTRMNELVEEHFPGMTYHNYWDANVDMETINFPWTEEDAAEAEKLAKW